MARFFNTTGPCRADDHYMLDPLNRLGDMRGLIDDKQYFVVHAPRQSGKTTTLDALAKKLTAEGRYAALKFSCEEGQAFQDDIAKVEDALIHSLTKQHRCIFLRSSDLRKFHHRRRAPESENFSPNGHNDVLAH